MNTKPENIFVFYLAVNIIRRKQNYLIDFYFVCQFLENFVVVKGWCIKPLPCSLLLEGRHI